MGTYMPDNKLPYHLDPRLAGSNPAKDDGFLSTVNIRSTSSLGGEVKLSAPLCNAILKIPTDYDITEMFRQQN
jgi:hypothetical protein